MSKMDRIGASDPTLIFQRRSYDKCISMKSSPAVCDDKITIKLEKGIWDQRLKLGVDEEWEIADMFDYSVSDKLVDMNMTFTPPMQNTKDVFKPYGAANVWDIEIQQRSLKTSEPAHFVQEHQTDNSLVGSRRG